VASGLLSGEAEEGGGALVPVVGSAQVRSTGSVQRRLTAAVGEERGEAIRSISIRLRWERWDSDEYTVASHSVVMDYVRRLNKHQ
jgi:hypothetical protein